MAKPRFPLQHTETKAQVIGMMIEGLSDGDIAAALAEKNVTVTRQALHKFRHAHADEIAPVVAEVERQITDYAIAQKVNRIAGLDSVARKVMEWIDERGLVELQEVTTADGATITRERFSREVSAELRALYKAAAEEMGQLPRPADQNINVNVGVAVQLAWSDGTPA